MTSPKQNRDQMSVLPRDGSIAVVSPLSAQCGPLLVGPLGAELGGAKAAQPGKKKEEEVGLAR